MRNFIFPLFILILLMFSACKKPDETLSGVYLDLSIDLSYVDQNGNDLLRPSTPNAYDVNLFRLKYYSNGKLKTYFKSNYDAQYGVTGTFHTDSSPYLVVGIFPPADTTYLKLSNGDVDTIWTITDIENNRAYESITKVWYNGKLVWDESNKTERHIVVKKRIN